MAYREAKTEAEKKRGKSTDELSFKEALTFFKKRGKEKGLSKFRWRGDSYNVNGEKIGSKKSSTASTTTKSSSSSNVSSAPTSSKRPQARRTEGPLRSSSGGRTGYTPTEFTNDGGPRRGSRKPKGRSSGESASNSGAPNAMTSNPSLSGSDTSAQSAPSRPSSDSTPNTSRSILQNIQNKRTRAQDVLRERKAASERTAEIRANAPSFRDFFNSWKKENPSIKGAELIKAREKQREEYNKKYGSASTTPGMSKGGMVKSGNKDYKKSGMFYKSGSPRGYK